MTYRQALDLVPGDYVLIKTQNLKQTHVLSVIASEDGKTATIHCTDGDFAHTQLSTVIPNDKIAEKYIKDPKTRVFINHNDELGEWLYSVEVADSDGFWLSSFDSQAEAEQYIQDHHLKVQVS